MPQGVIYLLELYLMRTGMFALALGLLSLGFLPVLPSVGWLLVLLLGAVASPQLPAGITPGEFLAPGDDGLSGTLIDPLMLDQLGCPYHAARRTDGAKMQRYR